MIFIQLNSEDIINYYLSELFDLYKICFPDDNYMTNKLLKSILLLCKNNNSCILIENSDTDTVKIIGGLFILEGGKYTENGYGSEADKQSFIIFNIFVHPDEQRKGYASNMLNQLFLNIGNGNVIQLITREDNIDAQWLYVKHKFKNVKKLKQYYKHVNKDGLLFEKHL